MIINRSNIANLNQGFKTSFLAGFAGVTPTYQQIVTEVTSTTAEEVYAWLNALPGMREWIGPRVIKSVSDSQYKIRNRDWEDTISVERTKVEDDLYGIYTPIFSELGRVAAVHPDQLVWQTLLGGFTAECFDGQYFFDTDHPVGTKETGTVTSVSNVQAGSGNPWFLVDLSRALKPIIFQKRKAVQFVPKTKVDDDNVFFDKELIWGADARYATGYGFWQLAFASKAELTSANLNAARTAMMSLKNDEGEKLGIKPTHLIVGAGNSQTARQLINAELINATTNTDRNLVQIIESPWLD
jgi:phage major head subunit gpT-like protein